MIRFLEVYNLIFASSFNAIALAGTVIGVDAELDAKRFHRTENGVVLVTQKMIDAL